MAFDSRTGLDTLTDDECWALVQSQTIGRLAVAIKSHPDIFPVNYAVDGETIVVNTLPGLKLAAAIFGSDVAFEVDDFDSESRTGWSVVVKGPAVEITDKAELEAVEHLGLEPWADSEKYRYLRIAGVVITGRRTPQR